MENTEDKIQTLREGRVATMVEESANVCAPTPLKKEEAKSQSRPNQNLLDRIDQLTRERVGKFEEQQQYLEKKREEQEKLQVAMDAQLASQTQVQEQTTPDESFEEAKESEVQTSFSGTTQIEFEDQTEEDDQTKIEAQAKQRTKKIKFRIKFISIAVCIGIALFSGLAIHNAVRISQLSDEVAKMSSQVEVDAAKYIYKISKLDDLIEDGKKAPVDSFQIGADRYLESFPEEIEDVTEIAESSNWFDRFVNKIRKFFGRA